MPQNSESKLSKRLTIALAIGGGLYAAGWMHGRYVNQAWPFSEKLAGKLTSVNGPASKEHDHDHDDHDHADHGDDHANSIELSETARKNLGLTEEYLREIELQSYQKTVAIPAIVIDKPGRTRLPVSAAMTGIVTHVHAESGMAIRPGELILEMRLTHEDLVTLQKEFLQSIGDRDIELREIERLEQLAGTGAISNKTLLDRQYSRDKIESLIRSQREALRLHGLSESQIQKIESEKRLLTEIRVYAPSPDDHSADEIQLSQDGSPVDQPWARPRASRLATLPRWVRVSVQDDHADHVHPEAKRPTASVKEQPPQSDNHAHAPQGNTTGERLLVLYDLPVKKGQIVSAGDLLCTLADYSELLIEGQAFETEAGLVSKAKIANWSVSAIAEIQGQSTKIDHLELGWLNNEIDPGTRTLKFFVLLPNEPMLDSLSSSGQRHILWKYRTGQRMQLLLPTEIWEEQFVLPVSAVVQEGPESFVFQANGDHFDRVAVHEKYRDQWFVVIENDGAIFPGDVIALRGAHQMQMALKNKSGQGADPHAGHQH